MHGNTEIRKHERRKPSNETETKENQTGRGECDHESEKKSSAETQRENKKFEFIN
jgi:hypothetical protein